MKLVKNYDTNPKVPLLTADGIDVSTMKLEELKYVFVRLCDKLKNGKDPKELYNCIDSLTDVTKEDYMEYPSEDDIELFIYEI